MRLALKTASYGTAHVGVATAVAYALSGDLAIALGIGLLEPIVQTGVYAVHERLWERPLHSPGERSQSSSPVPSDSHAARAVLRWGKRILTSEETRASVRC